MINLTNIMVFLGLIMVLSLSYILAFRVKWRGIFAAFLVPLAQRMPSYITPNHITILSFFFILIAGIFIYLAKYDPSLFLWAALFMFLFALIDSLDGFLARIRGQITKSGSFLDYTLDKLGYLLLLLSVILGGHIKTELAVTTMLLSLFYNVIDLESLALSESKSPLTEHSRWLVPVIILCLAAFLSKLYKFEALTLWGGELQILDILFLILPAYVLAITIYKITSLWKNLNGLIQEEES